MTGWGLAAENCLDPFLASLGVHRVAVGPLAAGHPPYVVVLLSFPIACVFFKWSCPPNLLFFAAPLSFSSLFALQSFLCSVFSGFLLYPPLLIPFRSPFLSSLMAMFPSQPPVFSPLCLFHSLLFSVCSHFTFFFMSGLPRLWAFTLPSFLHLAVCACMLAVSSLSSHLSCLPSLSCLFLQVLPFFPCLHSPQSFLNLLTCRT